MDLDLDLLASIASGGLGHWYDGEDGAQSYVKDEDCVACLKDLQGFFRFDDPVARPAFFAVSKYNFARSDLVPLIVTYPEDYDVVYNALKVCVFLTMPSSDPTTEHPSKQAAAMLQVCEAFLAQDALAVVVGLLADPLSRHPKMTDRDAALTELVITFLRNLLAATVPPAGASPLAEEAGRRVRTGLLERMFADDVAEMALLMAQHARERPFKAQAPVLLDLFLSFFTDASPEALLGADAKLRTLQAEAARASAGVKKRAPAVRPRAPGAAPPMPRATVGKTVISKGPARGQYAAAVYMRRHMDHGAGVVVRHAPAASELPSLDPVTNPKHRKAQVRGDANAGGPTGSGSMRSTQLLVRLNEFLGRFLAEAYTPLVGQVFKDARSGLGVSMLEEDDFERFVRFVGLCTQYARLREEGHLRERMAAAGGAGAEETDPERSPFECLSATMGWDAFHTVLVLLQVARDREQARLRNKALRNAPRRYALLDSMGPLLREMLLTLDLARVAGNAADRHAADRLQRRLAFDDSKDSGVLEILARAIRDFSYTAHSRAHAVHLSQVLHIVLGMLDRLAREKGGIMVRKEVRHRRASVGGGSALKKKQEEREKEGEGSPAAADALVPEIDLTREGEEAQAAVADVAEKKGGAEAEADAAEGRVVDATEPAAAPATAAAGSPIPATEEAFPATEEAPQVEGLAATEAQPEIDAAAPAAVPEEKGKGIDTEKEKELSAAVNDDDKDDETPSILPKLYRDIQLDLNGRLRKMLAVPSIVHFHAWLLQQWRDNAPLTNAALAAFFARVAGPKEAGGLELPAMLWQLSVLRVFHDVMADRAARADPIMAEMARLATRVVRGLFERLAPSEEEQGADAGEKAAEPVAEGAVPMEGVEGEQEESSEAKMKRQMAELAPTMRTGAASLGFIELLFWKSANVAEVLAEEYNWRKLVEMHSDGGSARRGGDADGGGQLGFASFKAGPRGPQFSDEQTAALVAAFESCNGLKDCLDRLADAFYGDFKKSQISKKLRELGLYKGKFTFDQADRLRALFEVHSGKAGRAKFEAIAADLGAGFSAAQCRNKLKVMGVDVGGGLGRKSNAGGGGGGDGWDAMLGSEDEGDIGGSGGRSDASEREYNDGSDDDDDGASPPTSPAAPSRVMPSFDEVMLGAGAAANGSGDADGDVVLEVEDEEGVQRKTSPAVPAAAGGSGQKRRAEKAVAGPHKLRRRSDDNGRAAAEDDDVENRRAAALALLRKKHKAPAPAEEEAEAAAVPEPAAAAAKVAAPSPAGEGAAEQAEDSPGQHKENVDAVPAAPKLKTFGRARLKRLGDGDAAAAALAPPPGVFDDLEDF